MFYFLWEYFKFLTKKQNIMVKQIKTPKILKGSYPFKKIVIKTNEKIVMGYWTCCKCNEVNEKTYCWVCRHKRCSSCFEDK